MLLKYAISILFLSLLTLSVGQDSLQTQWTSASLDNAVDQLFESQGHIIPELNKKQTTSLKGCFKNSIKRDFPDYQTFEEKKQKQEYLVLECLVLEGHLEASDFLSAEKISVKGNWSEKDKQKAKESLQESRAQFQNYIDSASTDALILCLVEEFERNYENFEAVEQESELVKDLTQNCLKIIIATNGELTLTGNPKSKKGEWASEDMEGLVYKLETMRPDLERMMSSEKADELFVCISMKAQDHYPNFAATLADSSTTMANFMYLCMDELQVFANQNDPFKTEESVPVEPDPNSSKGNWSDNDKAILKRELENMRPDLEGKIGKEKTDQILNCIRLNFEKSFDNYADVNNHPDIYKSILDACYSSVR